ncbi:MAG TPA: lysylphosphatidylglycerol synthase domain-containing protein [Woeseiaceae bacterium]|nr:lysylphosphatidylglycerol synthase domain-containing protein [Woeseiaceae bacterium]
MRKTALNFLKRAAVVVFMAIATALVVSKAREMDWPQVLQAVKAYDLETLAMAFAIAVPAFLACASFDLVGRHATGHSLSALRTAIISYTGYFFSLNLGALVGGLAFRYRLYMPYGLSTMTMSQVIGLSIVTNWSGYVLIAGAVMAWQPPELPPGWNVSVSLLRGIGIFLLLLAAGYIAVSIIKGGSSVRLKDSRFDIPTISVTAIQVGLSMLSWGSIGAVITWLLQGEVSWFAVMPVLMMSAIAGIWSHVPSGLGVTEVVFVSLLGHLAPESRLLAAVLVFRIVYYIVPFMVAVFAYFYLEATARGRKAAPS